MSDYESRYKILVEADINEATKALEKLKKELKKTTKGKDLSDEINAVISSIESDINSFSKKVEGEFDDLYASVHEKMSTMGEGELNKELRETNEEVKESIAAIKDQIELLNKAIDSGDMKKFSEFAAAITKPMTALNSTIKTTNTALKAMKTDLEDLSKNGLKIQSVADVVTDATTQMANGMQNVDNQTKHSLGDTKRVLEESVQEYNNIRKEINSYKDDINKQLSIEKKNKGYKLGNSNLEKNSKIISEFFDDNFYDVLDEIDSGENIESAKRKLFALKEVIEEISSVTQNSTLKDSLADILDDSFSRNDQVFLYIQQVEKNLTEVNSVISSTKDKIKELNHDAVYSIKMTVDDKTVDETLENFATKVSDAIDRHINNKEYFPKIKLDVDKTEFAKNVANAVEELPAQRVAFIPEFKSNTETTIKSFETSMKHAREQFEKENAENPINPNATQQSQEVINATTAAISSIKNLNLGQLKLEGVNLSGVAQEDTLSSIKDLISRIGSGLNIINGNINPTKAIENKTLDVQKKSFADTELHVKGPTAKWAIDAANVTANNVEQEYVAKLYAEIAKVMKGISEKDLTSQDGLEKYLNKIKGTALFNDGIKDRESGKVMAAFSPNALTKTTVDSLNQELENKNKELEDVIKSINEETNSEDSSESLIEEYNKNKSRIETEITELNTKIAKELEYQTNAPITLLELQNKLLKLGEDRYKQAQKGLEDAIKNQPDDDLEKVKIAREMHHQQMATNQRNDNSKAYQTQAQKWAHMSSDDKNDIRNQLFPYIKPGRKYTDDEILNNVIPRINNAVQNDIEDSKLYELAKTFRIYDSANSKFKNPFADYFKGEREYIEEGDGVPGYEVGRVKLRGTRDNDTFKDYIKRHGIDFKDVYDAFFNTQETQELMGSSDFSSISSIFSNSLKYSSDGKKENYNSRYQEALGEQKKILELSNKYIGDLSNIEEKTSEEIIESLTKIRNNYSENYESLKSQSAELESKISEKQSAIDNNQLKSSKNIYQYNKDRNDLNKLTEDKDNVDKQISTLETEITKVDGLLKNPENLQTISNENVGKLFNGQKLTTEDIKELNEYFNSSYLELEKEVNSIKDEISTLEEEKSGLHGNSGRFKEIRDVLLPRKEQELRQKSEELKAQSGNLITKDTSAEQIEDLISRKLASSSTQLSKLTNEKYELLIQAMIKYANNYAKQNLNIDNGEIISVYEKKMNEEKPLTDANGNELGLLKKVNSLRDFNQRQNYIKKLASGDRFGFDKSENLIYKYTKNLNTGKYEDENPDFDLSKTIEMLERLGITKQESKADVYYDKIENDLNKLSPKNFNSVVSDDKIIATLVNREDSLMESKLKMLQEDLEAEERLTKLTEDSEKIQDEINTYDQEVRNSKQNYLSAQNKLTLYNEQQELESLRSKDSRYMTEEQSNRESSLSANEEERLNMLREYKLTPDTNDDLKTSVSILKDIISKYKRADRNLTQNLNKEAELEKLIAEHSKRILRIKQTQEEIGNTVIKYNEQNLKNEKNNAINTATQDFIDLEKSANESKKNAKNLLKDPIEEGVLNQLYEDQFGLRRSRSGNISYNGMQKVASQMEASGLFYHGQSKTESMRESISQLNAQLRKGNLTGDEEREIKDKIENLQSQIKEIQENPSVYADVVNRANTITNPNEIRFMTEKAMNAAIEQENMAIDDALALKSTIKDLVPDYERIYEITTRQVEYERVLAEIESDRALDVHSQQKALKQGLFSDKEEKEFNYLQGLLDAGQSLGKDKDGNLRGHRYNELKKKKENYETAFDNLQQRDFTDTEKDLLDYLSVSEDELIERDDLRLKHENDILYTLEDQKKIIELQAKAQQALDAGDMENYQKYASEMYDISENNAHHGYNYDLVKEIDTKVNEDLDNLFSSRKQKINMFQESMTEEFFGGKANETTYKQWKDEFNETINELRIINGLFNKTEISKSGYLRASKGRLKNKAQVLSRRIAGYEAVNENDGYYASYTDKYLNRFAWSPQSARYFKNWDNKTQNMSTEKKQELKDKMLKELENFGEENPLINEIANLKSARDAVSGILNKKYGFRFNDSSSAFYTQLNDTIVNLMSEKDELKKQAKELNEQLKPLDIKNETGEGLNDQEKSVYEALKQQKKALDSKIYENNENLKTELANPNLGKSEEEIYLRKQKDDLTEQINIKTKEAVNEISPKLVEARKKWIDNEINIVQNEAYELEKQIEELDKNGQTPSADLNAKFGRKKLDLEKLESLRDNFVENEYAISGPGGEISRLLKKYDTQSLKEIIEAASKYADDNSKNEDQKKYAALIAEYAQERKTYLDETPNYRLSDKDKELVVDYIDYDSLSDGGASIVAKSEETVQSIISNISDLGGIAQLAVDSMSDSLKGLTEKVNELEMKNILDVSTNPKDYTRNYVDKVASDKDLEERITNNQSLIDKQKKLIQQNNDEILVIQSQLNGVELPDGSTIGGLHDDFEMNINKRNEHRPGSKVYKKYNTAAKNVQKLEETLSNRIEVLKHDNEVLSNAIEGEKEIINGAKQIKEERANAKYQKQITKNFLLGRTDFGSVTPEQQAKINQRKQENDIKQASRYAGMSEEEFKYASRYNQLISKSKKNKLGIDEKNELAAITKELNKQERIVIDTETKYARLMSEYAMSPEDVENNKEAAGTNDYVRKKLGLESFRDDLKYSLADIHFTEGLAKEKTLQQIVYILGNGLIGKLKDNTGGYGGGKGKNRNILSTINSMYDDKAKKEMMKELLTSNWYGTDKTGNRVVNKQIYDSKKKKFVNNPEYDKEMTKSILEQMGIKQKAGNKSLKNTMQIKVNNLPDTSFDQTKYDLEQEKQKAQYSNKTIKKTSKNGINYQEWKELKDKANAALSSDNKMEKDETKQIVSEALKQSMQITQKADGTISLRARKGSSKADRELTKEWIDKLGVEVARNNKKNDKKTTKTKSNDEEFEKYYRPLVEEFAKNGLIKLNENGNPETKEDRKKIYEKMVEKGLGSFDENNSFVFEAPKQEKTESKEKVKTETKTQKSETKNNNEEFFKYYEPIVKELKEAGKIATKVTKNGYTVPETKEDRDKVYDKMIEKGLGYRDAENDNKFKFVSPESAIKDNTEAIIQNTSEQDVDAIKTKYSNVGNEQLVWKYGDLISKISEKLATRTDLIGNNDIEGSKKLGNEINILDESLNEISTALNDRVLNKNEAIDYLKFAGGAEPTEIDQLFKSNIFEKVNNQYAIPVKQLNELIEESERKEEQRLQDRINQVQRVVDLYEEINSQGRVGLANNISISKENLERLYKFVRLYQQLDDEQKESLGDKINISQTDMDKIQAGYQKYITNRQNEEGGFSQEREDQRVGVNQDIDEYTAGILSEAQNMIDEINTIGKNHPFVEEASGQMSLFEGIEEKVEEIEQAEKGVEEAVKETNVQLEGQRSLFTDEEIQQVESNAKMTDYNNRIKNLVGSTNYEKYEASIINVLDKTGNGFDKYLNDLQQYVTFFENKVKNGVNDADEIFNALIREQPGLISQYLPEVGHVGETITNPNTTPTTPISDAEVQQTQENAQEEIEALDKINETKKEANKSEILSTTTAPLVEEASKTEEAGNEIIAEIDKVQSKLLELKKNGEFTGNFSKSMFDNLRDIVSKESFEKKDFINIADLWFKFDNLSEHVSSEFKETIPKLKTQLKEILDKNKIKLTNLFGQKYDDGFSADVLDNLSTKGISDKFVVVSEMIKPIIQDATGAVIRYGEVILDDADKINVLTQAEQNLLDTERRSIKRKELLSAVTDNGLYSPNTDFDKEGISEELSYNFLTKYNDIFRRFSNGEIQIEEAIEQVRSISNELNSQFNKTNISSRIKQPTVSESLSQFIQSSDFKTNAFGLISDLSNYDDSESNKIIPIVKSYMDRFSEKINNNMENIPKDIGDNLLKEIENIDYTNINSARSSLISIVKNFATQCSKYGLEFANKNFEQLGNIVEGTSDYSYTTPRNKATEAIYNMPGYNYTDRFGRIQTIKPEADWIQPKEANVSNEETNTNSENTKLSRQEELEKELLELKEQKIAIDKQVKENPDDNSLLKQQYDLYLKIIPLAKEYNELTNDKIGTDKLTKGKICWQSMSGQISDNIIPQDLFTNEEFLSMYQTTPNGIWDFTDAIGQIIEKGLQGADAISLLRERFNELNSVNMDFSEEELANYIAEAEKMVSKYGEDIVRACINSAEAETPAMKEAFEEISKIPESIYRNELKINSPSRIMEQLGVWTVEGLNVGILESAGALKASLIKLIQIGQLDKDDVGQLINWNGIIQQEEDVLNKELEGGKVTGKAKSNVSKVAEEIMGMNIKTRLHGYNWDEMDDDSIKGAYSLAKRQLGRTSLSDENREKYTQVKEESEAILREKGLLNDVEKAGTSAANNISKANKNEVKTWEQLIKEGKTEEEILRQFADIYNRGKPSDKLTPETHAARRAMRDEAYTTLNSKERNKGRYTYDEEKDRWLSQDDIEAENKKKITEYKKYYEKMNSKYETMAGVGKSSSGTKQFVQEYYDNLEYLKNILDTMKDYKFDFKIEDGQGSIKYFETLKTAAESAFKAIKDINKNGMGKAVQNADIYKLVEQIDQYTTKFDGMSQEFKDDFERMRTAALSLRDTNASVSVLEKLKNQVSATKLEVRNAGQETQSFFSSLKARITDLNKRYLAMFFSFYDIIRYAREIFTEIEELDTAMTEMRKVSDESTQSLYNYQKQTFEVAGELGTTSTELQNATADWLRLGESIDEAAESAKQATILMNVSEFESIDEATESLTSMSQAYKDLDKSEIVDVMNNIGNNYSISTDELSTALQESAATLSTQGNDLYEAAALITSGNAITQDADKTGSGLRTIALRLAGTEEAEEELSDEGEDTEDYVVMTSAKKQKIIKDYTAVASNNGEGVDILDDNGNLKSTYEILKEISDVYAEIQEEDKQYGTNRAQGLVEELAGKNRSNIAASILENPDMLTSVYEDAMDSEGSAALENSKYLDSVEGKVSQIKNEFQEFFASESVTNFTKAIIELGTQILKLGKTIGAVPSLVGILTGVAYAKNGKDAFSGISNKIKNFSNSAKEVANYRFTGTEAFVRNNNIKSNPNLAKTALTNEEINQMIDSLNKYDDAQAKAILSSTNFSEAQQRQILAMRQAKASQKELTAEKIQEIASEKAITESIDKGTAVKLLDIASTEELSTERKKELINNELSTKMIKTNAATREEIVAAILAEAESTQTLNAEKIQEKLLNTEGITSIKAETMAKISEAEASGKLNKAVLTEILSKEFDEATVNSFIASLDLETVSREGNTASIWEQFKASVALKKAQLGSKAALTGVGIAIAAVGVACYAAYQNQQKFNESVQTLSDNLKTLKSDFDDYESQYEEYMDTINSSTSSTEDIVEARKGLIELQDEINEKYGDGSFTFSEFDPDETLKKINAVNEAHKKTIELISTEDEISRAVDWGLDEYVDEMENGTLPTQYGNIDMNNRNLIIYDEEFIEKNKDAMKSILMYDDETGEVIGSYYDDVVKSIQDGEQRIDTVLGSGGTFELNGNEVNAAFSPLLQSGDNSINGATFMDNNEEMDYIQNVIDKATEIAGENASEEDIMQEALKLDSSDGKEVGEEYGKGVIAGFEDETTGVSTSDISMDDIGYLMHFSGDYGTLGLNDVIEDYNASVSNSYNTALETQQDLSDMQDSIIEKYGLEKDALTDINTALGYKDELQSQYQTAYEDYIKDFNDNRITSSDNEWSWAEAIGNKIYNAFHKNDRDNNGNKYADSDGQGGYSNMDRATETVDSYFHRITGVDRWNDNELSQLQNLANSLDNIDIERGEINVSGNLYDAIDDLTYLQTQLESMNTDGQYDTTLEKIAEELTKEQTKVDQYGEAYNENYLVNTVMEDDDLSNWYTSLTNAYEDYQDAVESGNDDLAAAAEDEFLSTMQAVFDSGDEDAIRFFKNLYPEFESAIAGKKFSIDLEANLDENGDNFLQGVLGINLSSFDGMSIEDIVNYEATDKNKKDKNYKKKMASKKQLTAMANQYGFADLSEFLSYLESQGLLKTDGYTIRTETEATSLGKLVYGQSGYGSKGDGGLKHKADGKYNGAAYSEDTVTELYDNGSEKEKTLIDENTNDFRDLVQANIDAGDTIATAWKKALIEIKKQSEKTAEEIAEGLTEGLEEFNSIDDVYQDVKDGETFDYTNLANGSDFQTTFGDLSGYDEAVKKIREAPDDIEACQDAFNDLATEWMYDQGVLDDLTDDSMQDTINQLTQYGVSNAETLVKDTKIAKDAYESQISDNAEAVAKAMGGDTEAADISADFSEATLSEVAALATLDGSLTTSGAYMAAYKVEKEAANGTLMDESENIDAVLKLAEAADVSTQSIKTLQAAQLATNSSVTDDDWEFKSTNNWYAKAYEAAGLDPNSVIGKTKAELDKEISGWVTDVAQEAVGKFNVNLSDFSAQYTGNVASNDSDSDSSDTPDPEDYDWIETLLDRISTKIDEIDEKANRIWKTWKKRNDSLGEEMGANVVGATVAKQAQQTYLNLFNGVALSEDYKNKIRNGEMNVESIADDDLKDAISTAQDYWDKATEAAQTANDYISKFYDNLQSYFDNIDSMFSQKINKIQEKIDGDIEYQKEKRDAYGLSDKYYTKSAKSTYESYYKDKNKQDQKMIDTYTEELNSQKFAYNFALSQGMDKNSEMAESMREAMRTTKQNIRDKKIEMIENDVARFAARFDAVEEKWSKKIDKINRNITKIENSGTINENNGYTNGTSYYKAVKKQQQKNKSTLSDEYKALVSTYQKNIASGKIKMGSDEQKEEYQAILDLEDEIAQANINLSETNKNLREAKYTKYDYAGEMLENNASESSFLADLMSDDKLFNDNGSYTDEGLATLGTHAIAYDQYEAEASNYATAYAKAKKEYEADPTNKEAYDRMIKYEQAQQQAIQNAQNEKEAIKDLVSQGYDKLKEALSDIIERYKEMLETQKDLRDYEKNVSEQTETIDNYKKQLIALQGDDSEENKSKLQELQKNLEDAQDELDETEYDKWYDDQTKMLDDLSSEFEDFLSNKLDEFDAIFEDQMDLVNQNQSKIVSTLYDIAKENGYKVSDSMKAILDADKENLVTTYSNGSADSKSDATDQSKKDIKTAGEMSDAGDSDTNTSGTGNSDVKADNQGNGKIDVGDKVALKKGNVYNSKGEKKEKATSDIKDNKRLLTVLEKNSKKKKNKEPWIKLQYTDKDKKKHTVWSYSKALSDKGYYKGTKSADDELAWTQEKGQELIFRKSDGAMLTPLNSGDKVFTNEQTNALWDMSKSAVNNGIDSSVPTIASSVSNTVENSSVAFTGDIVISGVNNPEEFAEQLRNAINTNTNVQKTLQAQTLGVAMGKNKYSGR